MPSEPDAADSSTPRVQVVYVRNPSRAHKMLPLLEGLPVAIVKGWRDVLKLKRPAANGTRILVDNFGRWGIIGILASFLLRAPLIVRLRGEYFREERERVRVRSDALRWARYFVHVSIVRLCLQRAAMVIYNSRYLMRAMAPYVGDKPSAIVHNPFTAPTPARDGQSVPVPFTKGLRLLTVTNMNLYSKVQPLLEAIDGWLPPEAWEELDLHWVICGTGYHEERLRALIREKGLEDRVHLPGRLEGLAAVYEWSEVLAHLTRIDAFPNVPMEAMEYGRPVITNTDSCGTREIVFHGENGLVVESGAEFLSALHAYHENPELRERHARAGRSLVRESFSIDAQRRAMELALRRLA